MARIDVKAFENELLSLVEDVIGGNEEAIRTIVQATFENIWHASPVISHYYQANHRIQIRRSSGQFGSGGAALNPAVKPFDAQPGQFADNAAETLANEPAKLDRFELGDSIEIFNDVPYAEDIEQRYNIYGSALASVGLV